MAAFDASYIAPLSIPELSRGLNLLKHPVTLPWYLKKKKTSHQLLRSLMSEDMPAPRICRLMTGWKTSLLSLERVFRGRGHQGVFFLSGSPPAPLCTCIC